MTKLVNYELAAASGAAPMSVAGGLATPFDLAAATGDDVAAPVPAHAARGAALNEHERNKLARHPFEVAAAVLDRYSVEGPEALLAVPGEVERLKWVGLYPQRQGGDAFMLRVKVPGGVLTAAQARVIGLVASEFCEGPTEHPMFGNHFCDLTTRQAIQLHWLTLGAVPEVWRRFAEVGLTSVQACGDCARNVTSCQVSGVDRREVLDALPVARAISQFFTGNRAYANLPRKFKLSVTGCTEDCARGEINDVALRPARLGDEVGFEVLAGGGLSDGERLASDLDLFVGADDAVELCRAVAQLYVSSATARTAASRACATWSKSSAPTSSAPSSRRDSPSRRGPVPSPSRRRIAPTTWACTPSARPSGATSASSCPSGG